MKWIVDNWDNVLGLWVLVCAVVDFVTGWTKTDKDDRVWSKIKNGIISVISIFPSKKK